MALRGGCREGAENMIEGLYFITITPIMKDQYIYQLLDSIWNAQTPKLQKTAQLQDMGEPSFYFSKTSRAFSLQLSVRL